MITKRLLLTRFEDDEKGTLGTLVSTQDINFKLYTIERPWLDNQRTISCIPTGIYACERGIYYRGDKPDIPCFEVRDVPGRSEIKFHVANFLRDITGCIGLGLVSDKRVPAVWSSREAMKKFMRYLEETEWFQLEIKNEGN